MPPTLALLIGAIFVFFGFRSDHRNSYVPSRGLVWPSLWYLIVASHPLGAWLIRWGLSLPGRSDDPTEGSLIDRLFYSVLTVLGLWVLSRRKFEWRATLRRNSWLALFVAFMALSILWSQYPFVSFKRYIKVVGSIVMALIVLTDGNPFEATLTVVRRCLYVHLPMSIICTRYFRDIGVSFDWSGTMESWQGISTSKNTLGQIAMLGVLCFFWEIRRHWQEYGWRNIHVLYLLMALYLLKGSESGVSMTSVSVCAFSLTMFVSMQAMRLRPASTQSFVVAVSSVTTALITLVILHSAFLFAPDSLFGRLVTVLGRDITLTGRTDIWTDVYTAAASDPLLGVGFGGFWIGRLANIPWNANMSWALGQAHSGYVDTYLQLGIVGSILLAVMLLSVLSRLLASLADEFDYGCFKITLFVTILFVNITESTYLRGDHHLWFIMQLLLWSVPSGAPAVESADPTNYPRI